MWRLLPLLVVLGCLEVLVPWPDVAALVLTGPSHTGAHAVWSRPMSPTLVPATVSAIPGEFRSQRIVDASQPQLLVQARVISH
jgi:hypothetical protein